MSREPLPRAWGLGSHHEREINHLYGVLLKNPAGLHVDELVSKMSDFGGNKQPLNSILEASRADRMVMMLKTLRMRGMARHIRADFKVADRWSCWEAITPLERARAKKVIETAIRNDRRFKARRYRGAW